MSNLPKISLRIATSEAVKIFFSAIRNKKGLPFTLQLDDAPSVSVSTTRSTLLSLRGKYGNLPSSEEFCMRKQLEIDHEEKRLTVQSIQSRGRRVVESLRNDAGERSRLVGFTRL